MTGTPPAAPALPRDDDGILKLAAQSLFDTLAGAVQGMLVLDREHRIVWISEGYKRFLPSLGFADAGQFVGRRVEEVVPNTMLAQVIDTGRPILVDLLTNQAGTFLVSRLPLRDAQGAVIGAIGMVLMDHPESTMQPLMTKFGRLQRELEDARRQLAAQRRPKYSIASFIGSSAVALEVKRQARRVAATGSTVLLLGETGTGKELLAQGIHAASPRAAGPFIGVNIAAVPESLLEADFFGVAPGAYTGAERKGRDGKFRLADGGTLFLDEIGDMPLATQAKLLRALQEQEVEPLGSNQVVKVDVRVIAATSRDLPAMVSDGRFREDLYYRLAVVPIRLPALRERPDDLEALVEAMLDDIARRTGMPQRDVSAETLELLRGLPWRGNIRELRNRLEQACMMTDDLRLQPHHFAPPVEAPARAAVVPAGHGAGSPPAQADAALAPDAARPQDTAPPPPLPERIAALEREAIGDALRRTGGNRVAAARLLRISRAALYDKLALYPELARSG